MEQDIFKIVVTGPESAGKTTLARQLAEATGLPVVPEFARTYLEYLGRPYQYTDLEWIMMGQQHWQAWFVQHYWPSDHASFHNFNGLICDTDWTVIRVWEAYKYGTTRYTTPLPAPAPLYLLCRPDFAWQPDPLREHPEERSALFEYYLQLVQQIGANFHILSGDAELRLQTALQIIRGYC